MEQLNSLFTFKGYEAQIDEGVTRFHYQLTRGIATYNFTDTLLFKPPTASRLKKINTSHLDGILQSLHLILGISYWKLTCSKNIQIETFTLTKSQADFWNTVYTKGLGEFFYKNSIDYRNLIHFPYGEQEQSSVYKENFRDRSLVLLGAGKDSIVAAELMKKNDKDFALFSMNALSIHRKIAQLIDAPLYTIERTIDPQLFDLNRLPGVYNGHVPISAVYAFVSIFGGILYDYRYVVAANEASANIGNVSYLGTEINHQWSKSYEFEQRLQVYTKQHLVDNLLYFSLLRPLTEMHIVKLFSTYTKYLDHFTSCNRNFRIRDRNISRLWCGECAKCAFVFLLLAAYVPKQKVVSIFQKDLLNDIKLLTLYKELLGIEGFKPFDCVGTSKEAVAAFERILSNREYQHDIIFIKLKDELHRVIKDNPEAMQSVLNVSHHHLIPEEFLQIVQSV